MDLRTHSLSVEQTYGAIVGWPGRNSSAVREWIKNNPNTTLGGTQRRYTAPLLRFPCQWLILNALVVEFMSLSNGGLTYNLMYNSSCPSIVERCKGRVSDARFLQTLGCLRSLNLVGADYRPVILRAVSEALAAHYSIDGNAEFELYESPYPAISPPSDGNTTSFPIHRCNAFSFVLHAAVKTYGILFFYCGGMFFFIILLYQIGIEFLFAQSLQRFLRQGDVQRMKRSTSYAWVCA